MIELELFRAERLHEFASRVFQHFGVPVAAANQAADILVLSDLRGIDSHGIARLRSYVSMLSIGRINPQPNITIVRESPSTATVDGDNGLGLVVGPQANAIAMEKADRVGTGWVAVRHTNHYGIAGWYVLEALKRDMFGWARTNTTKIVAPLWGAEKMLGTNPLAIAFPGLEEPPVVIDMATPAAAFGKVEMAIRTDKSIPDGWAIDRDGNPTTNPHAMVDGGAMLPLGADRDHGGHKGYCLGAMVDLLCGPLPARGSVVADAVEVIGAAGAAVRRRLGASVGGWSPWQLVGAVSGGWLLHPARCRESINTSWLWAARV